MCCLIVSSIGCTHLRPKARLGLGLGWDPKHLLPLHCKAFAVENSDEGGAWITSGRRSLGQKLLCAIPDAYEVSTSSTILHVLPPLEAQLTTFPASSPSLPTLPRPTVQFPILRLHRAGSEGTRMGVFGGCSSASGSTAVSSSTFHYTPSVSSFEFLSAIVPPKIPAQPSPC